MAELDIEALRRWAAAGTVTARDVTALIAEVERLRHEVFTLTNSEDARVFFVEQQRDAYRDQVKRLADQILMQSTNPGGVDLPEDPGPSFWVSGPSDGDYEWGCEQCPAHGTQAHQRDAFRKAVEHENLAHGGTG